MLTWYWVWLSIFSKKRQIDRSFDEKVYYKFIDHRVKVLENLTLTLNVIGFHLLYSANRMQYCDWNSESIWTTISQHWLESKLSDKGISCTCFELFCENNSNEVSLNSCIKWLSQMSQIAKIIFWIKHKFSQNLKFVKNIIII